MNELKEMRSVAATPRAARHNAILFSVILTTFNRPALLMDALSSLEAQTCREFEVLLVNDNGIPVESLLADAGFPITYIRQGSNRGPAAARNTAHSLARGEYIVYLDDDDCFLPDHLQTLANAIACNPQHVIYTDAVFIIEELVGEKRVERYRQHRYQHDEYSKVRLFINNYIPVNTFAFPRVLLERVGGFDETLKGLEDWDFLMNLARHVDFRHVHRETVEVRMRSATHDPSRRSEQASKLYPALYRELYERHHDFDNATVRHGRTAMLRRLQASVGQGQNLSSWLQQRSLSSVQQDCVQSHLGSRAPGPLIAVAVLDLVGDPAKLAATITSLEIACAQYQRILPLLMTSSGQECVHFPGSVVPVSSDDWITTLNQTIADTQFDWLALIVAGDELTACGLLVTGLELLATPDCRALYCDSMYRQADGSLGAVLRPDFNLDYLLSLPAAMGRNWLLRRDTLIESGGFDASFAHAPEFELILRLISNGGLDGLGHIAEPLLITEMPPLRDSADEQRAILDHLHARGYDQAEVDCETAGQYRIRYGHQEQPLVSILILAGARLDHLQRCVESLLQNTRYPHYELLLIQDEPDAADVGSWLRALDALGEDRLRIISPTDQQPPHTALELGASHAHGTYLLLLSPETTIISGDWLGELLNHAQRPEVGVVGAKLVSPEGTVTHAGIILGLDGVAGRPFVGETMDSPGYMQRLKVDQNLSAVSRDCLMISREVLQAVGGLSQPLPARYLDIDLCLRVKEAGFLTVWAANALLVSSATHLTAAVEADDHPMYEKWLPTLSRDPAYNPNLSLSSTAGFTLADTTLSWRPLASWRPMPTVLAHPTGQSACRQYRLYEPLSAMTVAGHIEGIVSKTPLQPAELERLKPDSIILQSGLGAERSIALGQIKRLSQAFKVLDLGEKPRAGLDSTQQLKALQAEWAFADRVLVPTASLADALGELHRQIRILPSRLPADRWGALEPQRSMGTKLRVGWAGGTSAVADLLVIADVIEVLADDVEWIILGACPTELKRYVHEVHGEAGQDQYPARLAELNLDLAIAPLVDSLANQCKSNVQLLEYGACGYPVICSDIGITARDNLPVTYVPNRAEDWISSIRMHMSDRCAAARMGEELQVVVRQDWLLQGSHLDTWTSAWLAH